MIENSRNFDPDQFSHTREAYRLWKMKYILRPPPIVLQKEFFDMNGIIRILLKACFNDPNFWKFFTRKIFFCQRRLQPLENVENVETIITRYIEACSRLEVDHWIMIKRIFKSPNLHEILTWTNFCPTEQAIAFEKLANIQNTLNHHPEGIF